MAVSNDYVEFVTSQLEDFGVFVTKKMFGGGGFFRDGMMFGLIGHDVFYLKADDGNRDDFISKGMTAFLASEKKKGMPYWEVPVDILENSELLAEWADKAFGAAVRAKKK